MHRNSEIIPTMFVSELDSTKTFYHRLSNPPSLVVKYITVYFLYFTRHQLHGSIVKHNISIARSGRSLPLNDLLECSSQFIDTVLANCRLITLLIVTILTSVVNASHVRRCCRCNVYTLNVSPVHYRTNCWVELHTIKAFTNCVKAIVNGIHSSTCHLSTSSGYTSYLMTYTVNEPLTKVMT